MLQKKKQKKKKKKTKAKPKLILQKRRYHGQIRKQFYKE